MKNKSLSASIGLMLLILFAVTPAFTDSKKSTDVSVEKALTQFFTLNAENKGLAVKAFGMLVFPSITKAGADIAGKFGEGVLLVKGMTVDYDKIASASIGLTLGVASRSEIVMFITQDSLDAFKKSKGWKVGVNAGIAIMSMGAGGQYDTKTLQKPILGFVFGEKGLIGDLSIEGSKITKKI